MKPLVSIIVPVYNVELYLEKCLKSITNQTYNNLEIILVNDGSEDSSREICENFAGRDDRIILKNQTNSGLSSARNVGLDIASGQFVMFIDSDDFVHRQMVETMLNVATTEACDIAICDVKEYFENESFSVECKDNYDKLVSIMNSREVLGWFFSDNGQLATIACNKLYKSYLFKNIRFPMGRLHEDVFTTFRIIEQSSKIAYIKYPFYYYLQRQNSITTTRFSDRSLDYLDGIREMVYHFEKDLTFSKKYQVKKYYLHVLSEYLFKTYMYLTYDKEKQKAIRVEINEVITEYKDELNLSIKEAIKFYLITQHTSFWFTLKKKRYNQCMK